MPNIHGRGWVLLRGKRRGILSSLGMGPIFCQHSFICSFPESRSKGYTPCSTIIDHGHVKMLPRITGIS